MGAAGLGVAEVDGSGVPLPAGLAALAICPYRGCGDLVCQP